MNRAPHICIVGLVGACVMASTNLSVRADAFPAPAALQAPAAASQIATTTPGHAVLTDNPLRIVGINSSRDGSSDPNSAGTIRFVQATEAYQAPVQTPVPLPVNSTPTQPEQIAPGNEQPGLSPLPPTAGAPGSRPGTYENIGLGWKPIGAVSASIAVPAGEMPENSASPVFAQAGVVAAPINANHNWPTFHYAWEASAVPHNPLWFEDVNLERYGYTHGILQPWISGGRFFLNVVFLPYHLVAEPPGKLEYPLGYYRPGDPAPPVRQIKPVKPLAGVAEAAFIIGMIIILP